MPRARIILETSDAKKSAMTEAADLQGTSLGDWFEEQVSTAMPRIASKQIEEISGINQIRDLLDTDAVLASIADQDWAFTEDDTRYLTHDLHPYPAKFIPQIPTHLIARLSMPGDIVCDPFGGSATTAVEAVRIGRRALSMDANPLSALIGRVKTGYLTPEARADIEQLIAAIEARIISYDHTRGQWADRLIATYQEAIPDIPNIEKWFTRDAIGELALIRHLILQTTQGLSYDAAMLSLSRIVIRFSNQESETRYVSVHKPIKPTMILRGFMESMKTVTKRLEQATADLQFADARFVMGDSRKDLAEEIGENSIDLIVTSPPYPNATDYHLYHRFRLFWLGFDPKELGRIEIGSHLRHQRNNTGFEEYEQDMALALSGCARALQPGRYAVFVVGDAIFKGITYSTSAAIAEAGKASGLELVGVVERPIHQTKRSFAKPGRRARAEQLVILQKPNRKISVQITPPAYRMWDYEALLRMREIEVLTEQQGLDPNSDETVQLSLSQPAIWNLRRMTFAKEIIVGKDSGVVQPTWQKVLENGDVNPSKRKDPKYATHGLHPYKGKFYPQFAKSLIIMSGAPLGSKLLDPFCGSGTTLLEGMLNGYDAYGADFNPLAAKIAGAKTKILSTPREIVDHSMRAMAERIGHHKGLFPEHLDQFADGTHEELLNWFPEPVLYKLNWLLKQTRLFGNDALIDFFEVIISSLIREISDQDPTDLRIRRRKEPLTDAPVLDLFKARLEEQRYRLKKYWMIAGRQPGRVIAPKVIQGDSRTSDTMDNLGLDSGSVDCVVTSPPYATALPYIDTDRLSLLAIMGIASDVRSGLEERLTGSREIRRREKQEAEEKLFSQSAYEELPTQVVDSIKQIFEMNSKGDVGFRRANMPSLLWRYFLDMRDNLIQVSRVLKSGGKAYYVVGDSRTNAGGQWIPIETCSHITAIAQAAGLHHTDSISIDVTTENYKHIKNAITKNEVIALEKP